MRHGICVPCTWAEPVEGGSPRSLSRMRTVYLDPGQQPRRGPEYDDLVAETVAALRDRYGPALLIHWEDFASRNSYRLLKRFRNEVRQTQLPSLHDFRYYMPILCSLER